MAKEQRFVARDRSDAHKELSQDNETTSKYMFGDLISVAASSDQCWT